MVDRDIVRLSVAARRQQYEHCGNGTLQKARPDTKNINATLPVVMSVAFAKTVSRCGGATTKKIIAVLGAKFYTKAVIKMTIESNGNGFVIYDKNHFRLCDAPTLEAACAVRDRIAGVDQTVACQELAMATIRAYDAAERERQEQRERERAERREKARRRKEPE